jgi:hypothetical protein
MDNYKIIGHKSSREVKTYDKIARRRKIKWILK